MTGHLKEISPWGTGFIEDANGSVHGFHYTMIKAHQKSEKKNWSEVLEGRSVSFEIDSAETVIEVTLQYQSVEVAATV